eukprot:scaffold6315_cov116-Cylindrotheca_fusiformis.AAC.2
MEPADPLRCSSIDWDPCAAAFETGEFDFRNISDLLDGARLAGVDVIDDILVITTYHSDRGIEVSDSKGKLLKSVENHPRAWGPYGRTRPVGMRGNHILGFIKENYNSNDGSFGFRYNLQTDEYELFDAYSEFNINTTGWTYVDQAIIDQNENGDLLGYYFDKDFGLYGRMEYFTINKDGVYSRLEVPNLTNTNTSYSVGTFVGTEMWAGEVSSNAYWINTDGTGLQTIAPFNSTMSAFTDAVVVTNDSANATTTTFTGFVGYYTHPTTSVALGFIADTLGNLHKTEFPDSVSSSVEHVTDRCTIAGKFDGKDIFIGIPKEVDGH